MNDTLITRLREAAERTKSATRREALKEAIDAIQRAEVDPFNVGRHGPPERSQEV